MNLLMFALLANNTLPAECSTPLTFTAAKADSAVAFTYNEDNTLYKSGVKYKTKTQDWITYTDGKSIQLTNVGDWVQFKNTNIEPAELSNSTNSIGSFSMSGLIDGSGNIQSLLKFVDYCTPYCYEDMFYECTSLRTAPELPASALAEYCYENMFDGCISLITAPELPAKELANYCYFYMFRRCISLITAPELPASSLAENCYDSMFQSCTSLTSAPELPASSLTKGCYENMFYICTSLSSAPELPASALADACYAGMFKDCTSLSSTPELPASSLKHSCYYQMFKGCTSLSSAPELPASSLKYSCYYDMFYGCASLSSINVRFTDWNSSYDSTTNWVSNVAETGTFICPSDLPLEYGSDYIPEGWTVQTE